jgi:hypothetical protein
VKQSCSRPWNSCSVSRSQAARKLSRASFPGARPACPRHQVRFAGTARDRCLIAGFLLLNITDAQWAHAVGLVCLLAFILSASWAIIFTALGEQPTSASPGASA